MASKKGGLGKGLEAIFAENATEDQNATVTLKLSDLEPNREQPAVNLRKKALWSWRILFPGTAFCSPFWCVLFWGEAIRS